MASTQKERRQGIDVGSGLHQVSSVSYWYRNGQFGSDEQAKGAFRLAHQQGMDGMGKSVREWMGLTEEQFRAWSVDETLPPRGKG